MRTETILRDGVYETHRGVQVDIREPLRQAAANTREYPPECEVQSRTDLGLPTVVSVENASVLTVGHWLVAAGPVAVLNFASSTHPGGAWRGTANAQEESLARASGLGLCLEHQAMYVFHRERDDPMASHYVIHSPNVPVFRADDGALLEEPWLCSVITCAAVNARALARQASPRLSEVPAVMRERAHRVLATAVCHGHRQLVLGAWGCGVLGLDPSMMADIFRDLLRGPFERAFERVVFAITDSTRERRFIAPFERAMAHDERPFYPNSRSAVTS